MSTDGDQEHFNTIRRLLQESHKENRNKGMKIPTQDGNIVRELGIKIFRTRLAFKSSNKISR